MSENKTRIFRPSMNETELKLVCKALHFYKVEMEKQRVTTGLTVGNLHVVASLMANLLMLLHGKKVGRRKQLQNGIFALSDDALLHFKSVKEEWLKELEP
jgi:hypothetical protein